MEIIAQEPRQESPGNRDRARFEIARQDLARWAGINGGSAHGQSVEWLEGTEKTCTQPFCTY